MAFAIAFMQMFGGFVAELINLFMLATRSSVEFCVTFFVAFHVIGAIDNIYAEGVCDYALMSALHDPLIFYNNPKTIRMKDRNCKGKCLKVFLSFCEFCYNSFYYYYLPFLINFIPYISPGDPEHMPAIAH